MKITLNGERRLFIIPEGDGYTTAGFDYIYKQLGLLAQKLAKFGIELVTRKEDVGTLTQYEQYQEAFRLVGSRNLGTWFDPDTPKKVQDILEGYRRSRRLIRIFYGDPKSGCDWMQEYDMVGQIGRSTGVMKIPLLIPDGEHAGPGLLDACVVCMIDVASRREIYKHNNFHQPVIEIRSLESEEEPGKTSEHPVPLTSLGYTHGVWVAGNKHANFKSYGQAAQWVAFMTGHCMEQPE